MGKKDGFLYLSQAADLGRVLKDSLTAQYRQDVHFSRMDLKVSQSFCGHQIPDRFFFSERNNQPIGKNWGWVLFRLVSLETRRKAIMAGVFFKHQCLGS